MPQPAEPEGLDVGIVAGVVRMPFELWSIGQEVKELALSDNEAKQLSEPVKQLLDYYLPQIPAIAYAWIALTVNGFWIMRTRLLLIAAIKEQNKHISSAQVDATDKGQGSPRPPVPPIEQGVNVNKIKPEKV